MLYMVQYLYCSALAHPSQVLYTALPSQVQFMCSDRYSDSEYHSYLTTPTVTLLWSRSGEPRATTQSPGRRALEDPQRTVGRSGKGPSPGVTIAGAAGAVALLLFALPGLPGVLLSGGSGAERWMTCSTSLPGVGPTPKERRERPTQGRRREPSLCRGRAHSM